MGIMKEIRTKYSKEYLEEKIMGNQVWLERAILAIWNRQTQDEKAVEGTIHHNKMGFSGIDGKFMTSLGNQINNKHHGPYHTPVGQCLTSKQANCARRGMRKYISQLQRVIAEKMEAAS